MSLVLDNCSCIVLRTCIHALVLGDDGINFLDTVKRHPITSISEMWDLLNSQRASKQGRLAGFLTSRHCRRQLKMNMTPPDKQ